MRYVHCFKFCKESSYFRASLTAKIPRIFWFHIDQSKICLKVWFLVLKLLAFGFLAQLSVILLGWSNKNSWQLALRTIIHMVFTSLQFQKCLLMLFLEFVEFDAQIFIYFSVNVGLILSLLRSFSSIEWLERHCLKAKYLIGGNFSLTCTCSCLFRIFSSAVGKRNSDQFILHS